MIIIMIMIMIIIIIIIICLFDLIWSRINDYNSFGSDFLWFYSRSRQVRVPV